MLKNPIKLNFVGNLPGVSSISTLIVVSDSDYCQASAILRQGNPDGVEALWVRHEHHFAWLRTQLEHCGLVKNDGVEVSRTTPVSLLGDRWRLEIPSWLTDELILSEGLLENNLPEGSTSVAGGLLSPILGVLPEKISARVSGGLAEKLSDPQVTQQLGTPILTGAWKSFLDDWAVSNSHGWVAAFCKRLGDNPKKLWSDLTVWRLLRNYPDSALDYALDPAAASFVRGLPAEVGVDMSLSPEGRKLALDQIEQVFISTRSVVATRQRFENLLRAVSGELLEEFTALEEMLARAEFTITKDDLVEVRRHFRNSPDITDGRLATLDLFVSPPLPSAMTAGHSDAKGWMRWALDQYLPYRSWQIQRRVADPQVEQSAANFSEWYCENYAIVHGDAEASSIQLISRWRNEILQDRVSLILLVDNLPWFFWELFERALAKAGLHRHQSGYSFTPLPSHTSVCKPQLVSGKPDATGTEYLKLMQARSANEWQGRSVHYLMGVDQLAGLPAAGEPYVALLNYLAADEALHSDAEATGSTWTEQLELLFGNLSKAVGEFAKRVSGGGRDFGIYVITDHGATLILPEERKAVDAQLTKKLFPNEKYRSATLNPSEAEQIPENFWAMGHRLASPMSDNVYFIPRGHNTVASSGQRLTFSHGGSTPEEVLVPSGLFRLYSAAWTTPKVRFVDLDLMGGRARFYIKRIVKLTFEVQNPNADECHIEGIELSPSVGEIRHFDAIQIPARGTMQGSLSLYFADSALSIEKLILTFDLRIGQDALPQAIELPVAITSATSGGIDLRNLLP
jgi:hypothetical protein